MVKKKILALSVILLMGLPTTNSYAFEDHWGLPYSNDDYLEIADGYLWVQTPRQARKDGPVVANTWKLVETYNVLEQKMCNKWYRIDENGELSTGWKYIDGNWYYFDSNENLPNKDHVMLTGWQYLSADANDIYNKKFYYFDNSGAMLKNKWVEDYYLGSDGAMLTNCVTPDGYMVDSYGKWIKDWNKANSEIFGTWTGKDVLSGYEITYLIEDDSIIEYTVKNPTYNETYHGSTSYTKSGNVIQLSKGLYGQFPLDNGETIYLSGNGVLCYKNDKLIATDYGEENSYEIIYNRK